MPLSDSAGQDAVREALPSPEEQAPPPPSPRVNDVEHPWPGLESFREESRAYFFGRDADIEEIHLRLRNNPLLTLYGRSGLGKTSILKAGLVPRLRAEGHRPLVERLEFKREEHGPFSQIFFALFKKKERIPSWATDMDSILARPIARGLSAFPTPKDVPSRLWLRLHWLKEPPDITHLILLI